MLNGAKAPVGAYAPQGVVTPQGAFALQSADKHYKGYNRNVLCKGSLFRRNYPTK